MDSLLHKQEGIVLSVVESIKHKSDERIIGEGRSDKERTLIGERCHLFNTQTVHCWGGKLQGSPEDWSQHFKHIKRGPYFYESLKNFHGQIERAAKIKGAWREDDK
eukprot:9092220-Ditylum_brightwellii.AAC.1